MTTPTPLQVMEARKAEILAEADAFLDQRGALLDAATARDNKTMTAAEQATFDEYGTKRAAKLVELAPIDERIVELTDQEARTAAAAELRRKTGDTGLRAGYVTDAPVYAKGKRETSFFADLYFSRNGDSAAGDRLRRNNAMVAETRALTTVAGAGGEFAPPAWYVDQYIPLARAGRKFADSLNPMDLPTGVSSINLPQVTGGTTAAVQATNNAALSQTDMTTSSVSSSISTIGGKQVVSLQLLTQSGIPFDEVIGQDLANAYAAAFDTQVISGSGASGQLEGVYTWFAASGTVNTTYTDASPAVGGAGKLYAQIFKTAAAIEAARFLPPDTIWMHPRRWNWILASADSQNRPLVVPGGNAYNPVGSVGAPVAQGSVGQIGGLDVITDANISITTNTNQDAIFVGVRGDLKLWESQQFAASFDATYADSAGILFRLLAYSAAIPKRYTTSVGLITGTGVTTPTF